MRRLVIAASATLLLCAAAGPARAGDVAFSDSFESGLGNWMVQAAAPSRVEIVTRPVRMGSHAVSCTVQAGDDAAHGERCDLVLKRTWGAIGEGAETWVAFSTYFPAGYAPQTRFPDWNGFAEFHGSAPRGGQANVEFAVRAGQRPYQLGVIVNGGDPSAPARPYAVNLEPFRTGVWYDLIAHVVWSSDSQRGLAQVWARGDSMSSPRVSVRAATLYQGQGAYFKLIDYRAPARLSGFRQPATIVHDAVALASDWQSLAAYLGWARNAAHP